MKRKYYMRGLGIGVIVTCLIFMTALLAMGYPMSDNAIRRRAKQLGMVDASGDATDNDSHTLKELKDEEEKKNPSDAEVKTSTKVKKNKDGTRTTTTTTTRKMKGGGKTNEVRKVTDSVILHISGGDSSATVGAKLQKAGLVTSGTDFDHYLEQNGYDTHIRAGSFSIAKGSSYADIAKKITG